MDESKWTVVAGRSRREEARTHFEATALSVVEWPEEVEQAGQLLEEWFDQGHRGFIIYGGDELAGRLVTAYWRRRRLGAHRLQLWPLDVGDSHLSDQVGKAAQPRRAARVVASRNRSLQRTRVGTLKVTASTDEAAWYGWSFGAGWLYRAAEARRRARGGATNLVSAVADLARETLVDDEEGGVAVRVAVDHRPRDSTEGTLMASTLSNSYFGLGEQGEGAVCWEQLATSTLMRRAVTPASVPVGGLGSRPFDSIHLDTPGGWLLDGRLHGSEDAGVVQVVPGPTVELVKPAMGLVSRVRRLW